MNYSKIYHKLHKLYSLVPYFLFNNGYALPPLHAYLELTYDCNLRCKMCPFLPLISKYDNSEEKKMELTLDEIKSVIDKLPRMSLITFTGGEPFLRKDIFDILEYSAKRNKCHIVTNGNFLTEDACERLISLSCKNIFSKGLVMIGISVEGNMETHDKIVGQKGSFSKTLEGIKLLNDLKVKRDVKYPVLNLAVVISKWNYDSISEMVSLAEENGIDVLSFLAENRAPLSNKNDFSINEIKDLRPKAPALNFDILSDQIKIIQSKMNNSKLQIRFSPSGIPVQNIVDQYSPDLSLDHYKCFSSWSKIIVSPQGNIFPCLPVNLGNIRDLSLNKIWNGEKAKEFRRNIKNNGLFQSCAGCCMLEFPNKN